MAEPTDLLIADREKTHGDYKETARIIQAIKNVMHNADGWDKCTATERESLDMVANKIGRILSGHPHFPDHWDDIAGYARLVSRLLPVAPEGRT